MHISLCVVCVCRALFCVVACAYVCVFLQSSQAVRSAELARSALLEAEDALRREKETCGERMLQISSLQEHVERLERQV